MKKGRKAIKWLVLYLTSPFFAVVWNPEKRSLVSRIKSNWFGSRFCFQTSGK